MERKMAGMTGINQFDKVSFWRGKDIYNFIDAPYYPSSEVTSRGITRKL